MYNRVVSDFSLAFYQCISIDCQCGAISCSVSGNSTHINKVFSVSAEIVRAMTHVINQGMSMYWGTSRWSAMEIMVRKLHLET